MKNWLRRIRGAIGMGLTWAAGWIPAGLLFALGLFVLGLDPPGFVVTIATLFGALGFLGGSVFSGFLGVAEGRRRFDELSIPRVAIWGGLGGLVAGGLAVVVLLGGPGPQLIDVGVVSVTTLLGAGSAAFTLALARKAEDETLLAASAEFEEVGLTEKESGQLLGQTSP